MLWAALAVMAAVAVALVVAPLLRRSALAMPRGAFDREVYRDQLEEIARDRARGLLSETEAEAARAEVARRLLATEDAPAGAAGEGGAAAARALAIALALVVPAAAGLLYLDRGAPDVVARLEADAQARAAIAAERAEEAALVDTLARRLAERPDDARGWALLANALVSLRRHDEALRAFERATALAPDNAALLAAHGEALTFADAGVVTPRAKERFDAALAHDPGEPRARFYLGLADQQAGRNEAALERWLLLEAESTPDAPWLPVLRDRLVRLAQGLEIAPERLAALRAEAQRNAGAARGEAGGAAVPADEPARAAMIRGMVEGLAERLRADPEDAEGWARLARSYDVLGETAKALAAFDEATRRRPEDVALLTDYAGSLLKDLAPGTPPPPAFVATVDRLVALAPEAPDTRWLAGLAAIQRGDDAAAARHWRALLDRLEPGSPVAAELRRRVEALERN